MTWKRIYQPIVRLFQQLFLRKPMDVVQSEVNYNQSLRPAVTPWQMIGLGIGGIIGTGIFSLSGQAAAKYSGPSIIISFIITGLAAILSALSMSEMSTMMSSAGSVYTYTYVALGEYPAFMIGWLSTLLYLLGNSTVVVHWSRYVVQFIDLISDHNATSSLVEAPIKYIKESNKFVVTNNILDLPAIAITVAICFVLIIGIRETAIVNFVFVIIKVIILIIFIIAGSIYVDRKNYAPFFPSNTGSFGEYGVTGMLHASTFVFFAYVGFESVTAVAQEAREPVRSMPLALIVSLVISLLIYVGVCTVMVGLVPYHVLNTNYPLATAVLKATPFGSWLPILLSLGAIAALTTVGISILLPQSRIFYAMAHDGMFPSIFARVHHRTLTPWVSIVICGLVSILFSGIISVDALGETSSIAALITYIFVHICLIVMRYRRTSISTCFKVPGGPWLIPVLGIFSCILLLISTTKGTAIRFGVWMGVGHVIYFFYSYRHSKTRREQKAEAADDLKGQIAMNALAAPHITDTNDQSVVTIRL